MKKLLFALFLILIPHLSMSADADVQNGRYRIYQGDKTLMLDSKTGTTWRLVWLPSQSPNCAGKGPMQTPPECMVWAWELVLMPQMPK